jgi:carbon monoxide dehydrogenase subunit G
MRLHHSTTVQAGPDQVWEFLQDTRAVVACLPGAELTDDKGNDQYGGVLRIAVGPLKLHYNGQVDVTRRDANTRQLELAASARDRRGGGSVRAAVRVDVQEAADGTSVLESVTDLQLTGRLAALGRGVQDVSNTMFTDFSRRLAERITGPSGVSEQGEGVDSARQAKAASVETQTATHSASAPAAAAAGREIKLSGLLLNVTRQRLADLIGRWSEKLRL